MMAGGMSVKGVEELRKNLMDSDALISNFCEDCAKDLAGRLLREVGQRTPVGDYSGGIYECKVKKGPKPVHHSWKKKGMSGGTLRRAWSVEHVYKIGDRYVAEITNPTEYASYVEYGHRTANHKGWVKGHFMLTLSEKEIQRAAPAILEKKLKKFLEDCLNAE